MSLPFSLFSSFSIALESMFIDPASCHNEMDEVKISIKNNGSSAIKDITAKYKNNVLKNTVII